MKRTLKPELLDHLDPQDPRAVGSRKDLRRLNAWMGNARTVARALRQAFPADPPRCLVDLGAGDGNLMLCVARRLPRAWQGVRVVLLDRQDTVRPEAYEGLKRLGWQPEALASDVLDWLRSPSESRCDGLIANLFLHHFSEPQLVELLDRAAARARVLVAVEPRRSALGLALCRLLWLIGCNSVTRHDAPISVWAGFAGRELSSLWPAVASHSQVVPGTLQPGARLASRSPPLEEREGERRLPRHFAQVSFTHPGSPLGAWSLFEGPAGLASHAFVARLRSELAETLALPSPP